MNAAVVHALGAAPGYVTFAEPVAGEGEVLVTVDAAGLHRIVKSRANGTHYTSSEALPLIPGVDGVGRLENGTRVYFGMSRSPFGSFADRCITRPFMCLPIPGNLDDATVAAMMNPGISSWAALTGRAQFAAGESVLVLGATGVSGQLAVQVAKRLGARRVVAAGRRPEALDELKNLGADAVISLNQDRDALISAFHHEWATEQIDVILDYVWGSPAEAVLEAVSQKAIQISRSGIRFVQIGATAGQTISLPAATLRSSNIELLGSGFGSASLDQVLQSARRFLGEAARKPFQLKIKTSPLRDVEALWNDVEPGVRLVFQP
jgi:NADPH:quinone reductase-like Zn-dependent oxidoreductase